MLQKDVGVVLKAARSGETSRSAIFLGRESGKVRLLAKGALSPRSGLRGLFEVGNVLEVVYYFKEGRSLFFVREATVLSSLPAANVSLGQMAAKLAALELLDKTCYWHSPEESLVDLAADYLPLPEANDPLLLFLAFEYRQLAILGALPDFLVCAECGRRVSGGYYHPSDGVCMCRRHSPSSPQRARLSEDVLALIELLNNSSLADVARTGVAASARKALGKLLHWTYTFHVQGYALPEALKLIPGSDRK